MFGLPGCPTYNSTTTGNSCCLVFRQLLYCRVFLVSLCVCGQPVVASGGFGLISNLANGSRESVKKEEEEGSVMAVCSGGLL